MLQLLNISNIALIDELQVEFDTGLNLLTGETGSGKSIIVDAVGVLIGGKFTNDLLKSGADRGAIEGLFSLRLNTHIAALLTTAGIQIEDDDPTGETTSRSKSSDPHATFELIIRREISANGRNKIFINNQLATQSLLRDLRQFLVDIHGQGDQQTLFNPRTHLELLDSFAGASLLSLRQQVAEAHREWTKLKTEFQSLQRDEAERFQLLDTLTFQIQELERVQLSIGEDTQLEDERRRLLNVEKLTALCQGSYARIYEDDDAALAQLRLTTKEITELAEFEASFGAYLDGLESSRALLEDLAFSLREYSDKLEYSPERLAAIEDRLVELSRLKRKYGGSIESALEHLARSQDRLQAIEHSDERELELKKELDAARTTYTEAARKLHSERVRTAKKLEHAIERGIGELAMDGARFQVVVTASDETEEAFSETGTDRVEFYFSANVGEEVKPLARVASGGEASRLMLVLKTVANASQFPRTIVFDEIDTGIGGRVSETVGQKLKKLSQTNQVLCVTHQAQIARFADNHLVVEKEVVKGRTRVSIGKLDRGGRVEEIARMLTGAEITESARKHAKELLKN